MNTVEANLKHYDSLWSFSRLFSPSHWAHHAIIRSLPHKRCLEIGPGTKPKIPIKNNYFLDISPVAVERLNQKGAIAKVSNLQNGLPFPSNFFDLVCAFELLEHVPDDEKLLFEINRVLKKQGVCLLSFPINMKFWNLFDAAVGHIRRYDPDKLHKLFQSSHFSILQYAAIPSPWPSSFTGKLLAILSKISPGFVVIFQDFLDLLPNSALRRPLLLKRWSKKIPLDLYNCSTIFVSLGKQWIKDNMLQLVREEIGFN